MKRESIPGILILVLPLLMAYTSPKKPDNPNNMAQYAQDYNAGIDAQENQEWGKAIGHYKKATNAKPNFSDAWNNMGYCYRQLAKENLDSSGDAYRKAISFDSRNAQALEYQGEYYLLVGRTRDAYKNYQTLRSLDPEEASKLKAKLDPILKQAQEVLKVYDPS